MHLSSENQIGFTCMVIAGVVLFLPPAWLTAFPFDDFAKWFLNFDKVKSDYFAISNSDIILAKRYVLSYGANFLVALVFVVVLCFRRHQLVSVKGSVPPYVTRANAIIMPLLTLAFMYLVFVDVHLATFEGRAARSAFKSWFNPFMPALMFAALYNSINRTAQIWIYFYRLRSNSPKKRS